MKKLFLYWNTLRYLKPVQIYGRLYSFFKSFLPILNSSIPNYYTINKIIPKTNFIFHEPWNTVEEIRNGKFWFLNQVKKYNDFPNWKCDNQALLWKFNLHYFNYLHMLNEKEKVNLCVNWIENNPNPKDWHPYVLSLRIVNWCKASLADKRVNTSLFQQAQYLNNNLEFYHPANHYLENARALIFAGLYFESDQSAGWLAKGIHIFQNELPKQVLKDGAYFELSPMYHSIVLEGILDIINIYQQKDQVSEFLNLYAKLMLRYLKYIKYDDGSFPLLSDSTTEIAPNGKKLLDYGNELGLNPDDTVNYSENESGVHIMKHDDYSMTIDGGPLGPDFIPAHAHADIFSYELRVMNCEFIVDSGVYEYRSGEMREYCRSTKAHNTVTVDGKDQAEMWGSFRVGKRYAPNGVQFFENEKCAEFKGQFDGYSKLIGDQIIHRRKVILDKLKSTFSFHDVVSGKGNHLAESYIHFHPEVNIIQDVLGSIYLERNNITVNFRTENKYKIIDGFFSPRFGVLKENKVIVLSNQLPAEISYTLEIEKFER